MTKPLVVSDCDEVLLHMVSPFKDWLGEQQGIDFIMKNSDFGKAMRYAGTGDLVPPVRDLAPARPVFRYPDAPPARDNRARSKGSMRCRSTPMW